MMHARYFFKYKIFKYEVFKTHIKPDCYLFYLKTKSSLVTCVGRKLAHPRPQTGLTQKSGFKLVVSYKSCMKPSTLKL